MADLSANGLSAGSYDLKLTVYTQSGNSSGGGCGGPFDSSVGAISSFTIVGNLAPVATDDAGAVDENSLLSVAASGVLTNDTDANGDAGAVDEDATVNVAASGVLGNDTDADSGDTLTVSAVRTGTEAGSGTDGTVGTTLSGTYGDLTLNADGSYTYDANNAEAIDSGASETDTFTYTLSDGTATDTAELVITINGANDVPIAVDDTGAVNEDDTATVANTEGVLANDTDADANASLSVTEGQPNVTRLRRSFRAAKKIQMRLDLISIHAASELDHAPSCKAGR